MDSFDYIIVGAGSAGCVLAERLSQSGRHKVLVLEAGGRGWSPWIALPLGYGKTFFDPKVNWKYQSEPEAALAGRSGYWPRGKVVGGSGAINALVYARGLPRDFDDWAAAGATGWNWDAVRQTYEAMETRCGIDGGCEGSGPLHVQDVSDQIHPANRHFFAAAKELGLPRTEDINGSTSEGATAYRINTRHGRRMHSARAFLKPALKRPNVTLMTNALAERIVFEGKRAVAVQVIRGGRRLTLRAGREIILAAGAVTSPRLLQLSGIGPADLMKSHGIVPLLDAPHVGGNLQDHLGINYYFRATEPTLNNVLRPFLGKVRAALQYALTRRGPLALSVNQCGGYFPVQRELRATGPTAVFQPCHLYDHAAWQAHGGAARSLCRLHHRLSARPPHQSWPHRHQRPRPKRPAPHPPQFAGNRRGPSAGDRGRPLVSALDHHSRAHGTGARGHGSGFAAYEQRPYLGRLSRALRHGVPPRWHLPHGGGRADLGGRPAAARAWR